MEHVRASLSGEEYRALLLLCEKEVRCVPEQLRHVVRKELERRGLLKPSSQKAIAAQEVRG